MSQPNNDKSSINKFLRKVDQNTVYIGVTVVALVATGVLIFTGPNRAFSLPDLFGLSNEKIAQKAIDYINNNKLSQTPASLVSVAGDSGLVKIKIKIGAKEFDSYVTRNGKLLFPQVIDMTKTK